MKVNKSQPQPKEEQPKQPESVLIPIVFEMTGDDAAYFGYIETLPGLDNRPWMSRQGVCVPPDVGSISVQQLRVAYSEDKYLNPVDLATVGPLEGQTVSQTIARATLFGTVSVVLSVTPEAESAWLSV